MNELIRLYHYHRRRCRMGRWKSIRRAVWCWF